jgi:transposase
MRYAQGDGLTAERQAFRERIRLQAAELLAVGHGNAAVAKELRVSVRSVQRWRRTWEEGGEHALASQGPVSRSKLSEALFAVLERDLAEGPVAHAWPDQTWTLSRISTLIGRRFHKGMTLSAIAQMLHRRGFSRQVPARRAVERGEDAVSGWVKKDLAAGGNTVAGLGAWVCFEDEAGFSMTPPTHADLGQARAHARSFGCADVPSAGSRSPLWPVTSRANAHV